MRSTLLAERARHEARVGALLAERAWGHRTARVRALGWDFGVRTNVPALGAHLDCVFAAMRAEGEPSAWYSHLATTQGDGTRHRVYRSTRRIVDTPDASTAFLLLLWDVNQQLFRRTTDKVLLHAAVLERHGRGLVLTAPSASGKTTLSVALVERGLGYLSDEAAAFDVETLLIHPFPKALSVDEGAQLLLERFRPVAAPAVADYLHGQWQVPPSTIRSDAVSGPVAPAWIVMPRYAAGSETRLVEMTRAEMLTVVMEQALNLHVHRRRGFEVMAEAVRRSRCYHLIMGDLDGAADTLLAAIDAGALDG